MQKLGRNDPCHCGSGKKYKRCCMEKDKEANVTRVVPENDSGVSSIPEYINRKLTWANELYRVLAMHFYNNTQGIYDDEEIGTLINIWHDYSSTESPRTTKPGVFPAALEYCLCMIYGYETTQSELAEKYDVSATSLSQRANQIMSFVDSNLPELPEMEDSIDGLARTIGPKNLEQELAQISSLLQQQNFESIDDANAFIQEHLQAGKLKAPKRSKPGMKEQAQDLLYDAWNETDPRKKISMAQQALELYPDSADAYNILAEYAAESLRQTAYYYKQGMLAGERDLGEEILREDKGHFWGYVPTRPYMRAKKGYADACAEMGNADEAIKHYAELLELNPNDNQGVRNNLLLVYLEQGQWEKAAELIQRYDEDASADFNYNRVLVEYALHGMSAKLRSLLKEAVKYNPHVPQYLLGKKRLHRMMPEYIGFGDDREAVVYAKVHSHLWQDKPKLLQLLGALK